MSDPKPEEGKESRLTKRNRILIGVSLVTLFLFAVVDIFLLLLVVPKFEQIFQDALPGRPLPPVTEFILSARIALVFIALGWPIIGTLLVRLQKRYAILWINVGTVWTVLQIGITVIALYMPMALGGDIFGMPDSNHP
jgi:hypothetical protein